MLRREIHRVVTNHSEFMQPINYGGFLLKERFQVARSAHKSPAHICTTLTIR